eukprot:2638309-Pyramimonas_sp.AAC.1
MLATRSATNAPGALALPRKPLEILDGDVSAQQSGGLFSREYQTDKNLSSETSPRGRRPGAGTLGF